MPPRIPIVLFDTRHYSIPLLLCSLAFLGPTNSNLCVFTVTFARIAIDWSPASAAAEHLNDFHWLPVLNRTDFKIGLLTFKILNQYLGLHLLWSVKCVYVLCMQHCFDHKTNTFFRARGHNLLPKYSHAVYKRLFMPRYLFNFSATYRM